MIDPEILRQLLAYDPVTGVLVWLHRDASFFAKKSAYKMWNKRYAGCEAFQTASYGYLHGHIFQKHYFAHRVAWALHYGEWPEDQIDHVNGIRSDNRIENLRSVSQSDNQKNAKLRHDNKSGIPGVDWKTSCSLWRVRASIGKRRILVGYYKNLSDAKVARLEAEKNFQYHANHGSIRDRYIP